MPTALELSRKGWRPYLEAARQRSAFTEDTQDEHWIREQILARLCEQAEVLKTRFGAKRVILFGSLAHTAWLRPESDIDLAVEGLEGDAYWQAWQLLEEHLDRPVDLVAIETASISLKQAIERHGREL